MAFRKNLSELILQIIFILISLFCMLPFVLMFITSITDENSLILNGYSFFPEKLSFAAYQHLFEDAPLFLKAYGITIAVTIIGVISSLTITTLLSYALSRKSLPLRTLISFLVFFTLLFKGGLVPMYLVYTQLFDIKNTIFALIIPQLLLNGFFVIIMRTFFQQNIPEALIESAYMDGAGEFKIFYRIILPLSLPILGTVGLMTFIGYWNDWFNGLIFINDTQLYGIQNLLNRILMDAQYMNSIQDSDTFMMDTTTPTESLRMAIAVISILPLLILFPFFQKFFVKGITIGSVKG